uniref:Uncharacterized protein n=1 Tax=Favella ehrenbergii TaxID=182087 RepID=A0A7S3HX17_9SPIT|mmetsp:Transcript_17454/g.22101  ORF Transcript_17454/g.22101 Transcript_17454/m.22101 type:complete len:132 (+) Transcript_17454:479-874(+)
MLFAMHIFVNVVQLQGWAEGNLMLLAGTAWYVFISIWDVGLILNLRFFREIASWKRTIPWLMTFLFACYFYVGVFAEIQKIMQGETWKDSTQEIYFAYILWLNTPTAIISTIYLIMLPFKTHDLSITHDDD